MTTETITRFEHNAFFPSELSNKQLLEVVRLMMEDNGWYLLETKATGAENLTTYSLQKG